MTPLWGRSRPSPRRDPDSTSQSSPGRALTEFDGIPVISSVLSCPGRLRVPARTGRGLNVGTLPAWGAPNLSFSPIFGSSSCRPPHTDPVPCPGDPGPELSHGIRGCRGRPTQLLPWREGDPRGRGCSCWERRAGLGSGAPAVGDPPLQLLPPYSQLILLFQLPFLRERERGRCGMGTLPPRGMKATAHPLNSEEFGGLCPLSPWHRDPSPPAGC